MSIALKLNATTVLSWQACDVDNLVLQCGQSATCFAFKCGISTTRSQLGQAVCKLRVS